MNTKSVLLVEDDATSARIYQSLFERQGYEVTVVPDGSDAFMLAHNYPYDILVLDLMLPNMDGLAMLRRFRAQKRFSHTPIFLYTSSELSQVEPLALEAGATKVFSKSSPPKEVLQAMLESVASLQRSRGNSPSEPTDTEVRSSRDFRVPGQADSPKLTLRMADAAPEPPVPSLPKVQPPKLEIKEEPESDKKGLLSRLFKPKSKDS